MTTDPSESLQGAERFNFELLKSSAVIVKTAKRLGYLNRRLEWRGKDLELTANNSAKGFQSGLIFTREDIEAEVDFWKGEAAKECIEALGFGGVDREGLLERLARLN